MLKRSKEENVSENKLVLVAAEDAGKTNCFWSEKDEV
jgi:hypothetical protein